MNTTPDSIAKYTATAPVMLVTGGSKGIGAATVLLAAQQGWQTAFCYRGDAAAAEKVVQATASCPHQALALQADIADEAQVEQLFNKVAQTFGHIDCLVNNAGIVGPRMRLVDMDLPRWQQLFATNVFGAMLCARAAVRHMSTAHGGQGGSIVNVGSTASRLGAGGRYIDYAASKGAIDSFTIGLAQEVAQEGIRVNTVRPGVVDTTIHTDDAAQMQKRAQAIPLQRIATPEEVAQAIVWLASPAASYVTGTLVDVAGGR
ncbi:MAG: SDR family oxidoreductase [Brachymonas sp.]|nr:SDR family oxidoreductase [Brachymonas sp.]